LQKKNNLNETVNYLADRYKIKEPKIQSNKKSEDPLDKIEIGKGAINISVVNKLPVKKHTEEVIIQAFDHLGDKSDKKAALKYSQDLLNKITVLEQFSMEKKFRNEILQNLKRVIKKAQSIINKIK
jgi:hypothetical protein